MINVNTILEAYDGAIIAFAAALRTLEQSGSTEEIRKEASGALWLLESRDKHQNRPVKPGQYTTVASLKISQYSTAI